MYELFSDNKIKKETKSQKFLKIIYEIIRYLLNIIGISIGVTLGIMIFQILQQYM